MVKCKAKICPKHCINLLVFVLFNYMFGFLAATCFSTSRGQSRKKKNYVRKRKRRRVYFWALYVKATVLKYPNKLGSAVYTKLSWSGVTFWRSHRDSFWDYFTQRNTVKERDRAKELMLTDCDSLANATETVFSPVGYTERVLLVLVIFQACL